MDLFYNNYVINGLFIAVLFYFLKRCYTAWKIYSQFSILHLLPLSINYHITRNGQDVPFSGFVFQNIVNKCQELKKEGIALTYIFRPMLILLREDAIKVFLNEKIAADKPHEYSFVNSILGAGLLTSSGERWRKHRKMLIPSFQLVVIKARVPLFNEYASALVKDMEASAKGASSDPLDLIKWHYFSALLESVFGLKQSEENKAANTRYFRMIDNMASTGIYLFALPWLQWRIFQYLSPSGRYFRKIQKELLTFTRNVVTEMERTISSSTTQNLEYFGRNMQKSLTYILFQHHLNDPSFTFEDIHAEVTTFMAAGYDTVSYSTMWCLFMLGLHPEVQDKAFNEVNSLPQDYISYEDSCTLTYLECVIMETLRLYPTVPIFGRRTTEDVQLGNYTVPKDSTVGFVAYLWHRNPDIYPDPEKFDPERFLTNKLRNSWTHIPFAEGNRTCIGKKYALLEMKIFLAYILRSFKITSLDKREDVVLCWNVLLTPEKPLRIRFERR